MSQIGQMPGIGRSFCSFFLKRRSNATPTSAEKEFAGLLTSAFIADAAKIVPSAFAAEVKAGLTQLKADLLAGEPLAQIGAALINDFGALAEAGVRSPYNKAAGKALAGMLTTARTNAIYGLLPTNSITKSAFNADIAQLKTGLETGKGFSALLNIF